MPTQQVLKKRTQKQRREEAEQKLVQALITVIDRDGLNAVTCESVSEEAQCSPGLVIMRLGRRSEMFVNLGKHLQIRSRNKLHEISSGHNSSFDQIAAFLDHHFDSFRDDPGYRAFFALVASNLRSEPELNELIAQARDYVMQWVQGALQAGVESGEFAPDLNIGHTTTLLGATFLGGPQFLKLYPNRLSHLEVLRQNAHACLPPRLR